MRPDMLVASILLFSTPATASNICGREYVKIEQLVTDIKKDSQVTSFSKIHDISTYYDKLTMTLWWVRIVRKSIVTCTKKIATDQGFIEGGVEADCNSDRTGICAAQAHEMAGVKF
jgi:hypothetical protein